MREKILFAWGASSLGDFLITLSEQGVVSLEFSSHPDAAEDALRQRFADAELVNGQAEPQDLTAKVASVIDHPGVDHGLTLDLRGSQYEIKVWTTLQSIPAGTTTSYGTLAAELGTRDARDVTGAIANNGIAVLVPCHRVVKKDGSISGFRWGVSRKKALLAREKADVALLEG